MAGQSFTPYKGYHIPFGGIPPSPYLKHLLYSENINFGRSAAIKLICISFISHDSCQPKNVLKFTDEHGRERG